MWPWNICANRRPAHRSRITNVQLQERVMKITVIKKSDKITAKKPAPSLCPWIIED
jgi:hypothetical protein